MKKNSRKYLLWLIGIVVTILAINFIYTSIALKGHSYKVLSENPSITRIFTDSVQSNMSFEAAFGNKNENVSFYSFKNDFYLIAWNINGFIGTMPSKIKVYSNDQFDKINFLKQNFSEWGNPKVKFISKLDSLNTSSIRVHVDEDSRLLDHKSKDNHLCYRFDNRGFAISDTLINYKLKVVFENTTQYDLCFYKNETDFFLLILYARNNMLPISADLYSMIR